MRRVDNRVTAFFIRFPPRKVISPSASPETSPPPLHQLHIHWKTICVRQLLHILGNLGGAECGTNTFNKSQRTQTESTPTQNR